MFEVKVARAIFNVLSIDIPLAYYAIGDEFNNHFHIVGAILIKPLHYYGVNTCQVEFHYIRTLVFGNVEAFKNGIEDMFEHSAIHTIHTQGIEMLDRYFKNTLIVFDKSKIWDKVFRGYKH